MQQFILLVMCYVPANLMSSEAYENALLQYRKSYSVYDKDNILKIYKAAEPMIIKYFQTKRLPKDFYMQSIRQNDLWTQSVLKDRFIHMDANKDGVFDQKDFNQYTQSVIFSDLCVAGADANNDYSITKKEFKQFLATLNPNQDFELALNAIFKDLDTNHDQIVNTNDFLAC